MLKAKRFLKYWREFLDTLRNQRTDISKSIILCFLFTNIALVLSCSLSANTAPMIPGGSTGGSTLLANTVPVISNAAILKGTVMEYCLTSSTLSSISPEQVLYRVVISVEVVEDVKGYPNFLKGKEGQNLTFFTKEKISTELFGKRIKARAKYIGDEKGGRFWINNIEILK